MFRPLAGDRPAGSAARERYPAETYRPGHGVQCFRVNSQHREESDSTARPPASQGASAPPGRWERPRSTAASTPAASGRSSPAAWSGGIMLPGALKVYPGERLLNGNRRMLIQRRDSGSTPSFWKPSQQGAATLPVAGHGGLHPQRSSGLQQKEASGVVTKTVRTAIVKERHVLRGNDTPHSLTSQGEGTAPSFPPRRSSGSPPLRRSVWRA